MAVELHFYTQTTSVFSSLISSQVLWPNMIRLHGHGVTHLRDASKAHGSPRRNLQVKLDGNFFQQVSDWEDSYTAQFLHVFFYHEICL